MTESIKRAEEAENQWEERSVESWVERWVENLYQCCLEPHEWQPVLDELCQSLGARHFQLLSQHQQKVKDPGIENFVVCQPLYQEGDFRVELFLDRLADRVALDRLLPHLCNAVKMSIALEKAAAVQHATSTISHNRLMLPFALSQTDLSITLISEALEQKALQEPMLTVSSDSLFLRDSAKNLVLQQYIDRACKPCSNKVTGVVEFGSAGKQIHVESLSTESDSYFLPKEKSFAILLLKDSSCKLSPDINWLQSEFGLTQRESELSVLLCEGFSLDEISQKKHVQTATLRKQLKSVFAKTHTRRQGELIVLLLNGM